jgi:hypothetical protein
MTHNATLIPSHAEAVTPSDATIVGYVGVYIGTTGNVALVGRSGPAVTFAGVPAGTVIPMHVTQVLSTGTTASNIVGFLA